MIGFRELSAQAYHQDPCETPSLSASIARVLVEKSPLHAYARHPRLGGKGRTFESTDEMDRGKILHDMILGSGAQIEVVDAEDWRTKIAKEQRAAIVARGGIAILASKAGIYQAAANAIRTRCAELGFNFGGKSELGAFWMEGETQCRGMLDHLEGDHIIDLKTTEDISALEHKFVRLGYDLQQRAYTRAVEEIHPELLGRVRFTFLFAEVNYPYDVVPVTASGSMVEHGTRRWRAAVNRWSECLAAGEWPGRGAQRVECPAWAMTEMEDA